MAKRDINVVLGIGMPPKRRPDAQPMPTFGSKPEAKEEVAEGPLDNPREERSERPAGAPTTSYVSPEMVSFRSADEVCSNCQHMSPDGNCEVLSMQVEPGDSCNAFSQKSMGMGAEGGMEPVSEVPKY